MDYTYQIFKGKPELPHAWDEWSVFLAQQHVAAGDVHNCFNPDFDIKSLIMFARDYGEDRELTSLWIVGIGSIIL